MDKKGVTDNPFIARNSTNAFSTNSTCRKSFCPFGT